MAQSTKPCSQSLFPFLPLELESERPWLGVVTCLNLKSKSSGGSLNNQVLSLTFCQSQNKACFSHHVSKKPSPHNYWHINLEWKQAKCWGCLFRERSCYVSANRILKINYFPPFIKAPLWQTKSPIFMEIITCFCHQSSHSYCIAFEHVGQWSSKEKDQRKC